MSSACVLPRPRASGRGMSDEALRLVAARFALLAEPMRLRLLHLLLNGEKPVNALVEATGGTQANISRHLHALADAGLLHRRKAGLQVFYSVADPSIFQLCDVVCGSLEAQLAQRAELFG